MSLLQGKNVVLGVTGGISAYKAAELCRLLRKAEATVRVVMTRAACRFITPLTLQTLSGHAVAQDLFSTTEESEIGHIRLADDADVVVVAPATADAIARFAAGMADDLLAAVLLATRAPVLLAPAMNVNMWENALTRANLRRLIETRGMSTVGPDSGDLACGWVGAGRLVDPAEILAAAERLVTDRGRASLSGRRVVVTAGPTFEAIDDVRFLGNRSSGKMGFAIAEVAARRGAEVTLVAGPVSLSTPPGVTRRVDVESALEMQEALTVAAAGAHVVVMAAAVSDFRPAQRAPGKISRRSAGASSSGPAAAAAAAAAPATVTLAPNPDLLAQLGRAPPGARPLLVGFAAEIGASGEELVARARQKLTEKGCDVIVANDVGVAGLGFGSDRNAVTLVFAGGRTMSVPPAPKLVIAEALWDQIASLDGAQVGSRLIALHE